MSKQDAINKLVDAAVTASSGSEAKAFAEAAAMIAHLQALQPEANPGPNQGSRGGSSKFRGVTWDRSRRKWMASAMLDGRRTTIGRFDSEHEAAAAAVAWRAQHTPFSEEAAA